MKKLYKLDSNGNIQIWTIHGSLAHSTIYIEHGKLYGSMVKKNVKVLINKSGRTIKEQIILEIKSRISKQFAKGYRETIEEAKDKPNLNELDLIKPMLAQRYDVVGLHNRLIPIMYRQYKLDGHRMLVTNRGGELIAYSRTGKLIHTMEHVLKHLKIPEGITIDGELYLHGTSLQTISSWAKRLQEDTLRLKYHVYDMVAKVGFEARYELLKTFDLGPNVVLVDTWRTEVPINEDLAFAIDKGYEGLMLRHPSMAYNAGARCNSLIKVKKLIDAEYRVVDIFPSSDGWAILVCDAGVDDKRFNISAPGTIEEKTHVLEHKDEYIGRTVNIEFFSYTDDGIPFHAAARYWRNISDE